MEEPGSTTITSKISILRLLEDISDQNLPVNIAIPFENECRQFRSSILKIDGVNNQLILHQLISQDWKKTFKPEGDIQFHCNMPAGTIRFAGKLSPLDDSETPLYYCLTIPEELTKKQLRTSFRVSLLQYKSETSIEIEEDTEISGRCRDLSSSGALVELPINENNAKIKPGGLIEECRLFIPDILEFSSAAKVCHLNQITSNNLLVGLNFYEMEQSQTNTIIPAMIKIQRLNIAKGNKR